MPSLTSLNKYNRAALRVTVAQICQTLGWQSASSVALDVLVDVMQNYLLELAKMTGRYANQFDRTLANLDDLGLALRELGVPVAELEEYVATVEPAPFPQRVPRLPVPRSTNLSFLKPGSQEIVTRPIHIYEHLPPMHPETAEEELNDSQPAESSSGRSVTGAGCQSRPEAAWWFAAEEEGRPMREILSVMMTTSGFISPAREGKLPETRLPEPLDDYGDDYRNVKTRKQRADTYRRLSERESERRNRDRDRERWLREDDLFDIIDVKVEEEETSAGASPEKLPTVKETAKLKPFKKHVKAESTPSKGSAAHAPPATVSPRGKAIDDRARLKKKKKLKPVEGKSSKLSIFKKIAKSKQGKSSDRPSTSGIDFLKKKAKKKVPPTNRTPTKSSDTRPPKPPDRSPLKSTDHAASKSAEHPSSKAVERAPTKGAERAPAKAADRGASKHVDRSPPKAAERAPVRPRSPSLADERRDKPRPLAARPLDPRRSPSDASDGSRSPTPDLSGMTPLKRLEMAERAEKKKEKEHKKNKKDKKDKKKKDKKDKEKKDLKTDKKEKKKKEEKDKIPPKAPEVPKLTLRLGSHDSSNSRSPTPEAAAPKLVIKPMREQAEPSASAPVGKPSKKDKPEKKKVDEPPPALLKPPKKEKKKSPSVKPKKTPPKAQPAAVIAETVGSFLDNEGNRIWICPECGRQDDGSPMIGCDRCDDWYHWVCVGIQVPPDKNEDWFCPRCIAKKQDSVKQKGKGRGKKK
ncbi:transcription initiation factor TFIID subunit 3-like [Pollicipes pollicipes]|uniref:transcription initiation factor TFIID subunit 3-like n=1 Tax=Pollicipes pollicipes TaxID=41117 RepID=UPI0018851FEA|nr:transcription initiation factor TFIID subunit 3-like [Pollicipes pollicipes]